MSTSRDIRDLLEARARSGRDAFLISKTIFTKIGPAALRPPTLAYASYDRPCVSFGPVRSTGQCNTACSLSAGVWKPKVFRGR